MSVECGECEWGARAGHDPDCSRSTETRLQRLQGTLDVEHEAQRQLLQRLGIEWTPGEPFYALVEDEIRGLRARLL